MTQSYGPDLLAARALGEITFDAVRAPETSLIGELGQGFVLAVQTIEAFRMSVGAVGLGFAQAALQASVAHALQRKVKGGLLSEQQLTQVALADMYTTLNGAQLLVTQAAWEFDAGHPTAAQRSSAAKLVGSEVAQIVCDKALQLHGALGLAKIGPTERLYRQVRSLRIYEGTSEMQRIAVGQSITAGLL